MGDEQAGAVPPLDVSSIPIPIRQREIAAKLGQDIGTHLGAMLPGAVYTVPPAVIGAWPERDEYAASAFPLASLHCGICEAAGKTRLLFDPLELKDEAPAHLAAWMAREFQAQPEQIIQAFEAQTAGIVELINEDDEETGGSISSTEESDEGVEELLRSEDEDEEEDEAGEAEENHQGEDRAQPSEGGCKPEEEGNASSRWWLPAPLRGASTGNRHEEDDFPEVSQLSDPPTPLFTHHATHHITTSTHPRGKM